MSIKTEFIESSDEYFHVYNRGAGKGNIFFEDRNYLYFISQIDKYLVRDELEVLSYCLMPNHYHVIFYQIVPMAISSFLGTLCKSYVQAINNSFGRTGHLFEGKYKIKHIDDSSYLIHLSRYVHLNPVRAGLVRRAEDWQYSSCREYYGLRECDFIKKDFIINQIGSFADYKKFVEEYLPEDKNRVSRYLF